MLQIIKQTRRYACNLAPVPLEVEVDVLRAEAVGRAAKADFVRRLESSDSGCFFDPIKRKKLKTMEACSKKITLTSSQGKVIIMSHYLMVL